MEKEIWKDIKGYSNYMISNQGRVYSKFIKRVMGLTQNKDGYISISLFNDNGVRKTEKVHRLVLINFVGNPPEGKTEVNHINCVRCDNHLENLEWVSHEDNNKYASQQGHKGWHTLLCKETGELFNTSTEASKVNGGDKGNIRKSARSNGKYSVKGYHYIYL